MHVEMWLPWKRDMSRIELTLTKCMVVMSLVSTFVKLHQTTHDSIRNEVI